MYPCGPSHSHHSRSHHWVLVVRWYRPGQSHDLGYEPSEYAPSLQSAVGRGTIPTLESPCTPSYRQGKSLGTMLTDLEKAMDSLIDVYHKYSLVKGNYHAVYKDDLKKLLETECPQYTKEKNADAWFKELDFTADGAINFEEFLILVIKVALAAHEASHQE
uniref:EF-hand domain-containing protein n=3 Tax=Equus TaxID=9789 RepID=A0A9L0KEI4_EQUAS